MYAVPVLIAQVLMGIVWVHGALFEAPRRINYGHPDNLIGRANRYHAARMEKLCTA